MPTTRGQARREALWEQFEQEDLPETCESCQAVQQNTEAGYDENDKCKRHRQPDNSPYGVTVQTHISL